MSTVLELVNQLLEQTGQARITSVSQQSTPARQALAALNDTYGDLLQSLPLHEFVRSGQLSLVAGQATYTLPPTIRLERLLSHTIKLALGTEEPTLLTQLTLEQAALLPASSANRPTRYWFEGGQLHLWANPDKNYTLSFRYSLLPSRLSTDSQTLDLPASWETVLLKGAQGQLALFLGERDMAQASYALYQDQLGLLKSQASRNFSHRMKPAYRPYSHPGQ